MNCCLGTLCCSCDRGCHQTVNMLDGHHSWQKDGCMPVQEVQTDTHTHTHTRARAHTHTCADGHARTRADAQTRTHTDAHTRAPTKTPSHTHPPTSTACEDLTYNTALVQPQTQIMPHTYHAAMLTSREQSQIRSQVVTFQVWTWQSHILQTEVPSAVL